MSQLVSLAPVANQTLPLDPRDHSPASFMAAAEALGARPDAARRLMCRVVRDGICTTDELKRVHSLPRGLLNVLGDLPRLKLIDVQHSRLDPFIKLAFATLDNHVIETVLIPLEKPGAVSLCLSSQVGCPMGCTFCATATMKTRRNLATWEIIDQVIQAREFVLREGRRVTGAVFMGMGEPFLNYDRVLAAAETMSCPWGTAICGKSITISTVGLVPEIDRFTRERRRFRLSISLGAATDEQRREIVPIAALTPVADVMAAARRHILDRGRGRMNLSYVCISGFNVSEADAVALAQLIGDTPVRLDLIDVTDPTGRFRPPTHEEREMFRDALTKYLAQPVVRRYSGGADIEAACGTLAARNIGQSLRTPVA
jgi:23S rRNA (adenine2503-C2)-methyltransferase